jgi:hypothetical protein
MKLKGNAMPWIAVIVLALCHMPVAAVIVALLILLAS